MRARTVLAILLAPPLASCLIAPDRPGAATSADAHPDTNADRSDTGRSMPIMLDDAPEVRHVIAVHEGTTRAILLLADHPGVDAQKCFVYPNRAANMLVACSP